MAQDDRAALTIWRRPRVQTETGYSRSTLYLRIAQGLWPKPVRLGVRAVGWPAGEVAALNAARIAWPARRGTTRPGGTSRSSPPDGIQWSVVRAWLCNAPGFYGTRCIDSPRCPAAMRCRRSHALYGGRRHTGRARRLAGGDEARGRRTHSRAMPDDERWREARRTRAMAGGDRQGAAAPSRSGRRCDRRAPQWRLRLCTTRTGLRGPWAWRPPSRARQMANAVSGVVRQRTGSPARRQHGSKVTRDR